MSHHHPQWNAAGTWAPGETQQQWHYGAYQPYTEQTTVVHRAPAPGGGMRTKLTVGLAAAAVGLLAAGAWVGFGPASAASADTVRLQPVSSAGASPFLTPVGQDKTGVTAPAGTGGSFTGDTPGLYAEGDQPSCDTSKLVSGLQGDSAKSTAWAGAMGIEPTEIPKFVNSLSPVLLRSDTAVTDHGFKAGTFAPSQAVLEAGTSVLINGFGEPTVKCYSGDPLTKPVDYDIQDVQFVGEPWTGFEPEHCTFVEPTHEVIETHVFIDYEDNRPHEEPGKPYPWKPNPEHNEKGEHGEDKGEHGEDKGEHGKEMGGEHGKNETPDPVKEKAAMDAKAAAEMAAKDARAARDKADDAAANILAAQGKVTDADARLQTAQSAVTAAQAKVNAGVPGAVGELATAQAAADEALRTSMQNHTDLDNAKNQAKYADAAADDAEAVNMQAKKNAEQTQADADRTAGRIPGNTGIVPPGLKTLDGEHDGTEKAATAEGATAGTTTAGTTTDGTTTDGTTTDGTTTDGTTGTPATEDTEGTEGTEGTTETPGTKGTTTSDGTPGTTDATTPDTEGTPGTTPPAGGESSGTASPFMAGMAPAGPPAGTDATPPATDGGTPAGPPAQQGPPQGGGDQGGGDQGGGGQGGGGQGGGGQGGGGQGGGQ